jgi:hypothetical protein
METWRCSEDNSMAGPGLPVCRVGAGDGAVVGEGGVVCVVMKGVGW